ncbi:hypothetical protein [Candidatus Igneacidithiobacillus taiwanensis]|uniref:hypothetical protein n=1 Tax=Candidatus Igneacidithiobacillus taiwanensis TaxID=1945924 RepID=UPI00289953F8|nr:hypothetical protein [Candidatus Igneacidithiobacillus taiwanensis]MCE5360303.1 hypothetical protein [Acidithiobacillus sp.]
MSFHPLLRAYRWLFPLFLVVLPTPFALAEIPSRAMDDCPALAKSTYTDDWISARCRQNPQSPWQRVCEVIRTY